MMIHVKNLSKSYGPVKAVDGISFEISAGEVVGFLGPNGAGKSTTMRVLTGFLGKDGGEVRIDGDAIDEQPEHAKSKIGYLPENNPLYEDMGVLEYLDFVGELRGMTPEDRRRSMARNVELYGLTDVTHKDIGELSKGYRQRVGLACASLTDPPIMILDEPTNGLDPNQIQEIRKLIREIGKTKTVILSTHNLAEVQAMCSRVLVINRGRIVADDSLADLEKRRRASVIRVRVKGGGDLISGFKDLVPIADGWVKSASGLWTDLELAVAEPHTADEACEAVFDYIVDHGWKLAELRRQTASLESVFADLTRNAPLDVVTQVKRESDLEDAMNAALGGDGPADGTEETIEAAEVTEVEESVETEFFEESSDLAAEPDTASVPDDEPVYEPVDEDDDDDEPVYEAEPAPPEEDEDQPDDAEQDADEHKAKDES